MSDRPSIYEFIGGTPALERFVEALHHRCIEDPVINHAFSGPTDPDHLAHLVAYLAEVFGGPPAYSARLGGHSRMLDLHARNGADDEFPRRFAACFLQATDDAALPSDPAFRAVWRDYITWAVADVERVAPFETVVPDGLPMPRWSWDGPVELPS